MTLRAIMARNPERWAPPVASWRPPGGIVASVALLVCAIVLAWNCGPAAAAEDRGAVRLEARGSRTHKALYAKNDGLAPASVAVTFRDLRNVAFDRPVPIFAVVPPRSETYLCGLAPRDRRQAWSYAYTAKSTLGAFDAVHDAKARYRLPYREGTAHAVGQAPGGPISTHTTPESENAIDIDMPEGTPVLAARDGLVVETRDQFTEGRPDKALLAKANRVRVLHADGTIASYAHLKAQGVVVAVGQAVKAGDLLGYSGATGYVQGPHLHLVVTRVTLRDGAFLNVSEPLVFQNGNPPATFALTRGLRVTANYAGPSIGPYGEPVAAVPPAQPELVDSVTDFLSEWWWIVALGIPVAWGAAVLRKLRADA
jgi:murein DD-endopeptidase MepM/ murein hydrolase activator NlpD